MVSRLTSGAQLRPRQNLCCSLLAEWLDRVHHLREISLDLQISEEGLERVEQIKLPRQTTRCAFTRASQVGSASKTTCLKIVLWFT